MAEVNANQMTVLRQRPGKRLRRYSRQRRCQPGRPQKVLLPFKAEWTPVLRFHLVVIWCCPMMLP